MKQIFLSFILLFASMTNALAQNSKERIIKNISYISESDTSSYRKERCKIDLYLPENKQAFKTIVWFHGGGLTGGEKEIPNELKGKGFAIVAPNYRLFPRCQNPQYTEDAAAAVAWTIRHIKEYGGSPNEIYVGGHSAGGYLTLMLCLDKSYLQSYGIDADCIKAYFPVSGQCATHYTIRAERKISYTSPLVDKYSPLNNVRKLGSKLMLITGDRNLEQMARFEENLYLKSVLEGIGNSKIPLYEMAGFNHSSVLMPAWALIIQNMTE